MIPLVISHGADWRAPRTMLERLKLPTDLQALVAPFILQRSRAASALEDELALIVDDLRKLSHDPGFRDYLTRLLSYTFETANGDMDAVHALLRANLALKFGVLPSATQERIACATHEELVEYSLRVLSAEILDAVFG